MTSGKGIGGQPAKLVPRTKCGWLDDYTQTERARNDRIAEFTRKALQKVNAPDDVFARAFTIMCTYHRQLDALENPRATADKNVKGVGRFKSDLRKRSEKMADQLNQALSDEASHDLNTLVSAGDIRSQMQGAHDALIAIVDMIDRTGDGETPDMSYAEIRREAGGKLKALARAHGLPKMEFVSAFEIYPTLENGIEYDAFVKWYQRLEG